VSIDDADRGSWRRDDGGSLLDNRTKTFMLAFLSVVLVGLLMAADLVGGWRTCLATGVVESVPLLGVAWRVRRTGLSDRRADRQLGENETLDRLNKAYPSPEEDDEDDT
jgi:hypothetical protein